MLVKVNRLETHLQIRWVFKLGKSPKISNSSFHTFFGLNFAFYAVLSLMFSGMANGVGPDQTAPSGAGAV